MNRAESEKFNDFMEAIDNADVDYTKALALLASIADADRSTNLGEETLGDFLDRLERRIHDRQSTVVVATEIAADFLDRESSDELLADILEFSTHEGNQ